MTIAVLLVTHNNVGESILLTVNHILGNLPLATQAFGVGHDVKPEQIEADLKQIINELDSGDGVLILTDMYGASPSNIAHQFSDNSKILVVTGLNLPMLLRIMNYPLLKIDKLAEKAISGGRDGIILNRRKD
jgi:PTS system mannose-specific IIA component